MKESHDEGSASHIGPESCVGDCEVVGEALTGVHAGRVSSCETKSTGTPTSLSEAEGHTTGIDSGEMPAGPAQSQTPKTASGGCCMRGNSPHGNRETSGPPVGSLGQPLRDGEPAGRSEKATSRSSDMHGPEESDDRVVPEQPAKENVQDYWAFYKRVSALWASCQSDEPAAVGGRRSTEGNTHEPAAVPTQSGKYAASCRLERVREAARKDKRARFTALMHHVTVDLLRDSFYALKRNAAPGVDGMTWRQYEEGLEARLEDLHKRVHRGTYRAQPSKRAYIPKPDGRLRPLGIAALEDKIVQHAVVRVLNAIYECDFLGFSYGSRPGRSQHDALDALQVGIMGNKVNWVLDADIRSFFDTIDHEWMMKFIEHRVADPRILSLISQWLRAGVSEDGEWSETKMGTPQGAVASPLLANVYLHYVFDLWADQWRDRCASGDVIIVRYADDFVMGFQHKHEAERFLSDLKSRMDQFGLSLHPDKTRLIEFGRFAAQNRRRREGRKPETFDFLGFTHACALKQWSRGFIVKRWSSRKRLRARLRKLKESLMRFRHLPMGEQAQWLSRVFVGWMNYHAVPGNLPRVSQFRSALIRLWCASLRRRSQRHRLPWERFSPIANRLIPAAYVVHPYPSDRFYAKHPK